MPIQNKDTLAASVPTPPLGSTTVFTDGGLLKYKTDSGSVVTTGSGSGSVTSVSVVTANGVSGSVATASTTPAITLTLGAITPSSVDVGGNITLSGTSRKVIGDFSAATATDRTSFQTSVTNGVTFIIARPNGTNQSASWVAENNSVGTDTAGVSFHINNTSAGVLNYTRGTGTHVPFHIQTGVGALQGITQTVLGSVVIGGDAALATNATDRFLYINSMAGTPVGTPTASPLGANGAMAGKTPITVDTTNHKLYFYSGGAWRDSTPSAVSEPTNQVVYGTGSGVDSDADLTYTAATGQLYVNTTTGTSGSVTSATPGDVAIFGVGYTTSGAGGAVLVQAGAGGATDGAGGAVNINGGSAPTDGNGGAVNITGGAQANGQSGGDVEILGGSGGTTGSGGWSYLRGGNGLNAGNAQIEGGDGAGTNANGGNVNINAGDSTGSGSAGQLLGNAGNATAASGETGGDIQLRSGFGSGTNGSGGWAYLEARDGTGTGTGGRLILSSGGHATAANRGTLQLRAGATNRLQFQAEGAWAIGAGLSTGTAGQVLTSGGASAEPTWTTPGGVSEPTDQLVYGTGSGVDSSSAFTYNATTGAFTLAPTVAAPGATSLTTAASSTADTNGAALNLFTAAGNGNANGGNILIRSGSSGGTSGSSGTAQLRTNTGVDGTGAITIQTGNVTGASGQAGDISIRGGDSAGNTAGTQVQILGGNGAGSGNGGSVAMIGGQSTSGTGGSASIGAGNSASGNGGTVSMTASNAGGANSNGGLATITAGNALGTGTGGDVEIRTGQSPSGTAGSFQVFTGTTTSVETLRCTPTGDVLVVGAGGLGYGTGSGGTVSQGTSRSNGVTLDKTNGSITLFSTAGSATPTTFTVTNNTVAATDVIILNQKSGTDLYHLLVTAVGAGSFNITAFTTGGTTTEAPVINFAVIKAVTA